MQESSPNERRRRHAVPGFPGWTHLVAGIAFPVWSIGTDAHYYGIDTEHGWWHGFSGLGSALLVVVLVALVPVAVAAEVAALLHAAHRWVARLTVVCFVLLAGFVTFIPTGLRFFGDMSPTPVDLITASLLSYGIVIGAEALLAYLICRHLLRRRTRGQRTAPVLTPP